MPGQRLGEIEVQPDLRARVPQCLQTVDVSGVDGIVDHDGGCIEPPGFHQRKDDAVMLAAKPEIVSDSHQRPPRG